MISLDLGALVVGLLGLALAVVANRRAQQANQRADVANGIAVDALAEARVANRIAEEANQLSKDANAVVEVQTAREGERWHVDWKAEWDSEGAVLTLTNTGGDAAVDPIVVIQGDGIHDVSNGNEDVAAGGDLVLPIPQLAQQRADHWREQGTRYGNLRGQRPVRVQLEFSCRVTLTIQWSTGLGRPQSSTIKLALS